MYTEEAVKSRETLKKNEIVSETIKDFITKQFIRDSKGDCGKEEYFKVFMKIGMILRPGIEADDLQRVRPTIVHVGVKQDLQHLLVHSLVL